MTIVYSGFDSIYFAIQGALSPAALKRFNHLKDQNLEPDRDMPFSLDQGSHRYFLRKAGKSGGYLHVINTGICGSDIAFKTRLSRDEYNGFVEISSACLLANGWEKAIQQELGHVIALGFHVVSISINRVDYCIDFLDVAIDINPSDFVAHSRVKKLSYNESTSVNEHVQMGQDHVGIRTVSQADTVKSITLGKMPGRQVILYDKRAEIIERRKLYWFDAWGINPKDPARTVHRVEVRAGKNHLLKYRIRTLEDFERGIGHVLTEAVRAIRWIKPPHNDFNVTRSPLHPLWKRVQTHMDNAMPPHKTPIGEEVITTRMRENKALEYKQQVKGNLGGFLGVKGVEYESMKREMECLILEVSDELTMDQPCSTMKSYLRIKDKWNT